MIATVTGRVDRVGLDHLVVTVGGIGILVHTTPGTAGSRHLGDQVTLATSLVVREDALTLYGFAEEDERVLFDQVQTVSGVGPRLAQAMLAVHSPIELRRAISSGDITSLTKVPGIGRKGAERIILELRDKVTMTAGGRPAGTSDTEQTPTGPPERPWRGQVTEALIGLGWSAKQAEAGLDKVAADLGDDPDVAAALKAALRELGR